MGRGLLVAVCASAAIATGAAQTSSGETAAVLSRAAAWVRTLERDLAVVIADEAYHQQIGDAPYPEAPRENFRDLQSEIAFLWVPDEAMWVVARNVRTVDKEPVDGSSNRLQRILTEASTRAQLLRGLRGESTRFNIGAVYRNFNDPTFALQYLGPRWQNRFVWARNGTERINGVESWRLDFTELNLPYVIQASGYTLQSAGRVWIDPATGAVHRTFLDVWDPRARVRARITTNFARDAKLGVVVPSRMTEEYIGYAPSSLEVRLTISGTAEYRNFRRFETTGRLIPAR